MSKDIVTANEIYRKLKERDELDRLHEMLRECLTKSGWKDKVLHLCKDTVQKHELENITVNYLIEHVRDTAREWVPTHIKEKLLKEIEIFVRNEENIRVVNE
ncbi:hypothetical protein A3Q56_02257 [Intoshia linei]|uniref:Enhancer of yellow 2 transcription factor homolog n=1 Tax=Intoshia linei TaxID=1819745 RepID=A0A177B6V8_9BILA|nr:hypothetical protein A3Q56_02257 [Intoshia linei]